MITQAQQSAIDVYQRGQADPSWYLGNVLDVDPDHLWFRMREIMDSIRDNERTSVGAGHGVSKTFTLGRAALWFLMCHYPSTVITTAPTGKQVKELLWREIRQSHSTARLDLGGKLTSTMLDMQHETGVRWFALGFSTKPDTVTQEATAFQGYHNDNLLIIFDEAAGILPEIWRAAEHVGAPFKRMVVVGNPTSAGGDFASSLTDTSYNHITISVKDTPNFKSSKTIIPGVYGRDYERRIRVKYGEESDEYRVRVLGEISQRRAEGAYYASEMIDLRRMGRVGRVEHNPNYPVYIVQDPGYTTALWVLQAIGQDIRLIRYYEDSGLGQKDFARIFREWERQYNYTYGDIIVPCDMDSNATKVVTGQTSLETLRNYQFKVTPLPREYRVSEGISRTKKFLSRCWFDEKECFRGIECVEYYHNRKNKMLSTEDKPVFTDTPAKDGHEHGADALRYVSMAAERGLLNFAGDEGLEEILQLEAGMVRPR